MICSGCGQTNEAGATACTSCGKAFEVRAEGPSATCDGCGATVHGPVGAMKCPYCGARVDVVSSGPSRSEPEEISDEERRAEEERARRHDRFDEDDAPAAAQSSSNGLAIGITIAVVAVVAIGVVAGARSRSHKASSKAERKSDAVTASPRKTAAPAKTSSPGDLPAIAIRSCRCTFGDGQSTPQVTLTLRAPPSGDPSRPLAMAIERKSGFMTESSSSLFSLPLGSALSPAVDGGALPDRMGVACDTGVYVLVSDKVATGWSSVNAVWKWTTQLPASLVDGADAGAPASVSGTDYTRFCTALPVQNGNATLSLAGGRHASLSLKDGKLH